MERINKGYFVFGLIYIDLYFCIFLNEIFFILE